MISNFEEITSPLTSEELKLLPLLLTGLRNRLGVANAVNTNVICDGINRINDKKKLATCKMTPVRLRKMINHIRRTGELNFVIGTSKGYFLTSDSATIKKEIESLRQRASAITDVADQMEKYLSEKMAGRQQKIY